MHMPSCVWLCGAVALLAHACVSLADPESVQPVTFLEGHKLIIDASCASLPSETESLLRSLQQRNRALLERVPNWVDEGVWRSSCFRYGLPDFALPHINKPVGAEATIADLLSYAAHVVPRVTGKQLRYVEIGVSVGKTLFQVINSVNSSVIYGFEAENINPVLAQLLQPGQPKELHRWELEPHSMIQGHPLVRCHRTGSLSEYTHADNSVRYLSGDVLDRASWSHLGADGAFNLIYSDALHDHFGLQSEFKAFENFNILDGEGGFVIIWDDLDASPDVRRVFEQICSSLEAKHFGSTCQVAKLRGWLGGNEYRHDVGVFTTEDLFDIQCLFKEISYASREGN